MESGWTMVDTAALKFDKFLAALIGGEEKLVSRRPCEISQGDIVSYGGIPSTVEAASWTGYAWRFDIASNYGYSILFVPDSCRVLRYE